jgi:hypothetical protein
MPTPTWDLTNQDCDALDGGWSSAVTGSGTVSLVIEDGRSCYKMYCPGSATSEARVTNPSISWTTALTYEIVYKLADVNHMGFVSGLEFWGANNSDYFFSSWREFNTAINPYPVVKINKYGGTEISGYYDGSSSSWHTARIVWNNGYVTIWIDGFLIHDRYNVGTTTAYSTPHQLGIYLICLTGHADANITVYIDNIKASSTAAEPDVVTPIKIQGQNIVSRIAQKGGAGWVAQSPLRYQKTNCKFSNNLIYEIPLVDGGDADGVGADSLASYVRIYDGTDVKALMKLPTF